VSAYYGYNSEYRFRIYVLRGDLQIEIESNNTIATANAMVLSATGSNAGGAMAGSSLVSGDLDYFNLGTLQAGKTVFLSTRQPADSTFLPVVSLYNAAGTLMAEATGGRAGDAVAQVTLSSTEIYYALVRTSGATSGSTSDYILDALVVPTADISFPNLQVTSVTPPPATGLKSGDPTTIGFRVDNLGNLFTAAVTWVDRVVLSADTVYGNGDDLELGVFPHSGPLTAASSYTVTGSAVTIPDGISGNFYVIVRTDHTNTVSEFLLEGDNETVTESPIAITLANYPDLVVEGLVVSEADASGNRTATWTLANRGSGAVAAGFSERFVVRNNTTGLDVVNNLASVSVGLAANATLARQATFTATVSGQYAVEVTVDAQAQRYENNLAGHAAAEINNVSSAFFTNVQYYTLAVAVDPVADPAAGVVSGGGTFASGSNRTVTATANSPYVFVGWFEGASLRSSSPSYTSPLLSNRTLAARFVVGVTSDLLRLASRVSVPAGGSVVAGFTVEGSQPKSILLRGAGPAMATFGVTGALADPRIVLSDSGNVQIATNDDWGLDANAAAVSAATTRLQIFALANGSKDAALLVTLNPGTYAVELSGGGGLGGIAMLEINDADTDGRPRIVMLTTRGPAGAGANVLTSSIVVGGTGSKTFLMRALGESLGDSNGVLRDPILSVYTSANTLIEQNNDWQIGNSATVSNLNSAAATAGARTLGASADSALLLTLNPGVYTAQVTAAGVATGESFLEIFEIDAQRAASFAPVITYLSRNQVAVPGGSAIFGVNVVAKPAATYQWRKTAGGVTTAIAGSNGPLLALNNLQSSDAASYDVQISNGIGAPLLSPARTLTLQPEFHSADANQDRQISVLEITRVIQLYNYLNGATRTGEYHTQNGTEDGFARGPGSITKFHSADANRDGMIDATELLRAIELFNYRAGTVRTGQYRAAIGTEDGFAPGPLHPPS
jgi:hypothetical protein